MMTRDGAMVALFISIKLSSAKTAWSFHANSQSKFLSSSDTYIFERKCVVPGRWAFEKELWSRYIGDVESEIEG